MSCDPWREHWNTRYESEEYVYGTEPNAFLQTQAHRIPSGAVLCVADGEGRNGVWLARQGYAVTSIDYSPVGLEKARKLAARYGVAVELIEADLLAYDFGQERYTGIVSIYSHFAREDMLPLHRKYAQALKPGGVLILEAFSKQQLQYASGGPKDIRLLYSVEDVRTSFSELEELYLKEEIVTLDEGPLHRGQAAVVRGVFRKPVAA
jgi:SAM-dependent methyltransferase